VKAVLVFAGLAGTGFARLPRSNAPSGFRNRPAVQRGPFVPLKTCPTPGWRLLVRRNGDGFSMTVTPLEKKWVDKEAGTNWLYKAVVCQAIGADLSAVPLWSRPAWRQLGRVKGPADLRHARCGPFSYPRAVGGGLLQSFCRAPRGPLLGGSAHLTDDSAKAAGSPAWAPQGTPVVDCRAGC